MVTKMQPIYHQSSTENGYRHISVLAALVNWYAVTAMLHM
jgi:hypothetical protein